MLLEHREGIQWLSSMTYESWVTSQMKEEEKVLVAEGINTGREHDVKGIKTGKEKAYYLWFCWH